MTFLYAMATLWPKLKHRIPIAQALSFTIFFVSMFSNAHAQSVGERTNAGLSEVKALRVGDKVPQDFWELTLPIITEGDDNMDSLSLAEHRHKPILLDFWSTWCSACIGGLQKIISYIEDEEISVLGVTDQTQQIIYDFLQENDAFAGTGLKSIVSDTILRKYFPFRSLPHLVWIDKDGLITAITGSKEIEKEDIQTFARTGKIDRSLKAELTPHHQDFVFDIARSIGKEDVILTYQMITPYINGVSSYLEEETDNFKTVSFRNRPIIDLYRFALSDRATFPSNRIIWQVADPGRFAFWMSKDNDRQEWLEKNAVCFEKKWNANHPLEMLEDLNSCLGLNVSTVDSIVECIVISARHKDVFSDHLTTDGISLKKVIGELTKSMPHIHLLEEIGDQRVRLTNIPKLTSEAELIRYFEENGLVVKKEKRKLKFLIIKS